MEIATGAGVTYEISVPLPLSLDLRSSEGAELELMTHQVVGEHQAALYGFAASEDRTLFALLLTAQGVGAKLALAMMSTLSSHRLARALAEEDHATLAQVPGIGRRTAEKISVALKNRVGALAEAAPGLGAGAEKGTVPQAVQALVGLGMAFMEAERRVRAALAGAKEGVADSVSVEELVKRALADAGRG